jgi:hypothetical protein
MTTEMIQQGDNTLPLPPLVAMPAAPDFSFITNDSSRSCIETGYKGVQRSEGWNLIRNFTGESFMFTNDQEIKRIMKAVNDEYGGGHSGSSIGWTMRQLERISHIGVNAFKNEWIAHQAATAASRAAQVNRTPVTRQESTYLAQ